MLNRYCAKLLSDTFTRLIPSWTVELASDGGHYFVLFLPINYPLKNLVVGQVMPSADNMIEQILLTNSKGDEWNGDDVARPGTTKRRQYY